ncbi:dienelactone hydrolase family protein [Pseudonocardia sp. McavD-2-B]|uniref:dienelactone hydrolase family protein n=1 Tax=Pseudonocardia sp. McavD-2-B TaxID=2954499 RepID=UPI0020972843|nr:dienelactone hydrolase family protein [Pseudonocardia sp. McavD-2-B]MCO7195625.1 dienelactone hydrolase family protein [Pseudonocardia sp. McavD-2-B]
MTVESEISLPSVNGGRLPGFLARPETSTPGPAIVMIYEIFGMTPEMRRVARDLAREGYTVLIPDLFARGRVKPLCIASTVATMATGRGAALGDCESARRWLADQPTVDADRIGVMGFCMGGGFAMLLSQSGLYRVAVPFYGRAGVEVEPVCPVVASFGGRDAQFADGYPQRLEADLTERGIPHDVVVYPEAGHSFMTRTPGVKGAVARRTPLHAEYHEPSATDATERVRAFLRNHL